MSGNISRADYPRKNKINKRTFNTSRDEGQVTPALTVLIG
jgi:hypothetical protein